MRLLALYATSDRQVRIAFDGETQTADGRAVPSIVDQHPAAAWPEREAHDLYGIEFTGHEPMRSLVDHLAGEWRVPVRGEGVHEVAVGPIHAGVIESGHFRLHVVGERVVHLDLRLFYKHRGLERAAEGSDLESGIAYAGRACAACHVSNSIAYAAAAEQLLGLRATDQMARARSALLELERLYNHLHDLSAICAGIGFAPGAMAFAALKERAQRLNQALFGHRFLFNSVAVGRSGAARVAGSEAEVAAIVAEAAVVWKEMLFNASVQDRLTGIGVLRQADALRLGTVGPAARASGIPVDARPGQRPAIPSKPAGDVAARAEVRHLELGDTAALLAESLRSDLRESMAVADDAASTGDAVGLGVVESPRGETVCCLEARDGLIARFHLRTGSYRNWPALEEVVPGHILPEFPLINKSFELCYACADR